MRPDPQATASRSGRAPHRARSAAAIFLHCIAMTSADGSLPAMVFHRRIVHRNTFLPADIILLTPLVNDCPELHSIARPILKQKHLVAGKTVLDLGCGFWRSQKNDIGTKWRFTFNV
jgi:hypothetical protein